MTPLFSDGKPPPTFEFHLMTKRPAMVVLAWLKGAMSKEGARRAALDFAALLEPAGGGWPIRVGTARDPGWQVWVSVTFATTAPIEDEKQLAAMNAALGHAVGVAVTRQLKEARLGPGAPRKFMLGPLLSPACNFAFDEGDL